LAEIKVPLRKTANILLFMNLAQKKVDDQGYEIYRTDVGGR